MLSARLLSTCKLLFISLAVLIALPHTTNAQPTYDNNNVNGTSLTLLSTKAGLPLSIQRIAIQ